MPEVGQNSQPSSLWLRSDAVLQEPRVGFHGPREPGAFLSVHFLDNLHLIFKATSSLRAEVALL